MATRQHVLEVCDIEDKPLPGAAIYVYHVAQPDAQNAATKYFYDRPKFSGNTNEDGRYTFPEATDNTWDDPATDVVDGATVVWNPFGGAKCDAAFTPNAWTADGLLLIKIVSGEQTEFRFMPMTELNEAFFSGQTVQGVYRLRTSLSPPRSVTRVVRPVIPDAIQKANLKPVAVAPTEVTVTFSQEFTIDGSKSSDPEGQPLFYRWRRISGGGTDPYFSTEPVWEGKAQPEPGDVEFQFYVIDGLRASEPVTVKVKVVAPTAPPGP